MATQMDYVNSSTSIDKKDSFSYQEKIIHDKQGKYLPKKALSIKLSWYDAMNKDYTKYLVPITDTP